MLVLQANTALWYFNQGEHGNVANCMYDGGSTCQLRWVGHTEMNMNILNFLVVQSGINFRGLAEVLSPMESGTKLEKEAQLLAKYLSWPWHPTPSCAPPVMSTCSSVHPELTPSQPNPHPDPQTLLPPVLAFTCTLKHLWRLCKHSQHAAVSLCLAWTSLTNRVHSRSNANHGTRSQACVNKCNS